MIDGPKSLTHEELNDLLSDNRPHVLSRLQNGARATVFERDRLKDQVKELKTLLRLARDGAINDPLETSERKRIDAALQD